MSSNAEPAVRFGDWISEGWRMFTEQWKAWVLLALGALAVIGLPVLVVTFLIIASSFAGALEVGAQRGAPPVISFGLILGAGLAFIALFPLSAYLQGGLYKSAFKQFRGGRLEFRDLFSAGDSFLPLLGGMFLTGLLVAAGSMLCVIPGLIAGGLLMFVPPLIVERKLGAIEAMRTSYELTKKNWLMFTLFALVVQLIASVGAYACYIGMLATYPLIFTMNAAAYRDCFGLSGALSFAPPQPPQLVPYAANDPYLAPEPPPPPQWQAQPERPQPPQWQAQPETPQPPQPRPQWESQPEPPPPPRQQPEPPPPPRQQPEPPPPPRVSVCMACQNRLPPAATFCNRCGTRVNP